MRLAWFTPWPPQPSGIAGRSAELSGLLALRGCGIDISVDERHVPALPRLPDEAVAPGTVRVQSAHDFVWRHARGQYDLVVYQVGNSRHHDFMWPYLFRFPGLVVLHDARLHHARARILLRTGGAARYRAELANDHPDLPRDAAELAVHGFDGRYYGMWPMTRAVVESARGVAVHSRGGCDQLAADHPDQFIRYLPLGEGRMAPVDATARQEMRIRHGANDAAVIFGVFGGLSADKRVAEIFAAFAATRRRHPHARLWLAGSADRTTDVQALTARYALHDAVTPLGFLDDEAFDTALAAVDISLNLRWPSATETSGPWLRALALGVPTVILELAHQAHLPALDPRDWRPRNAADPQAPITIAVDILDEHHSLVLAMDRLASDPLLRQRLGSDGRAYWALHHTPERMADAYLPLLSTTASREAPAVTLPASLRPDMWHRARTLMAPFGVTTDLT